MASPRLYKDINLETDLAFGPLEKEGRSYVVRLDPPLLLQTPALTFTSALAGPDGDEPAPFAYVQPGAGLGAFLRSAEAVLLQRCLERKQEWLRQDIEDDALKASFKSLFRPGQGFRLKVPQDVAVFGADKAPAALADFQAGTTAKCILVLKQLTFGKTEFGGIWRLLQAQEVPQPRCLITHYDSDTDSEFL